MKPFPPIGYPPINPTPTQTVRVPSQVLGALNRLVPHYHIEPEPVDEVDYYSYLGTPVYSPLEFLKTSGTSADNSRGVGERDGNSDVLLRIDTALITVELPKNIVKTQIQGRNGTVKEYIGEDDFQIHITGIIVSPYPSVYPRDEVNMLTELCRLPKQIPVASEFLQFFGIDSIVVEHFRIGQRMGSRNEVPFDVYAISDMAEELQLNPNESL